YSVEWRVINAADYGFAQRRRRAFTLAYKNGTGFYDNQKDITPEEIVFEHGFFAKPFPVSDTPYKDRIASTSFPVDLLSISDNYSFSFHSAGHRRGNGVCTARVAPVIKKPTTLGEILLDEEMVDEQFYLTPDMVEKFAYLRGPKKVERKTADGHVYHFSEGGMSPTDELDKPGRTMLTSEGSVNRSTHIVEVNGRKRFLTPIECERLNGFP